MKKISKRFSIVIVLFLTFAMILPGCTSTGSTQSYTEGTYTATAKGNNGDVTIDVVFTDSKIDTIDVVSQSETEGLGTPALTTMSEKIIEAQSLAVDTVTGATNSSNAMLNAVADAVDQAGGDSEALRTTQEGVAQGEDEEITADVVVVGGGASGTSAALAAAEKGATVIVLEKGENPGGAGRYYAEGLLAFESEQQKAAGIEYTVEDGLEYMMEYTHYLSNIDLTREIFEQSASTIDWLDSYGTETVLMENTQKLHYDDPMTYHKYVDKNQAYENMYVKLDEMGGTLYTNTTGKELIQDKDGNITGVIAEKKDGSKLTVNAKKVILATGGYAGSAEMIEKYMNVTNYSTLAYANNTGDGLTMAQDVGADEFNVNSVAVHSALIPSKDPAIWQGTAGQLLNIPLMWVNREGKRFVDEGVVYDFALWGNAAVAQGGEYFVIVDEATMKTLAEKGTNLTNTFEKTYLVGAGVDTKLSSGVVAPMENLYESLEQTIAAGCAYKADTIQELAKAMDVDVANLEETITTYNQAVKNGKDTKFLKDDEYLKYNVNEGPYYAIKAAALVEDSIGGIRVNSSLQVLTPEFKTIENLYAVGCDAGGIYGDSYPDFEGLTLSFAFNSGRLAGYAATDDLK
ncbi:MAG: FAD-dependent oxidoreductase [Eubacteriaceae bacterium]